MASDSLSTPYHEFAMNDTECAYFTLCWTVWQAGIDLWMERWIGVR